MADLSLVADATAERAPSLESEGYVPVHVLGRRPVANRHTTQRGSTRGIVFGYNGEPIEEG